jgi:hypothetical protein
MLSVDSEDYSWDVVVEMPRSFNALESEKVSPANTFIPPAVPTPWRGMGLTKPCTR